MYESGTHFDHFQFENHYQMKPVSSQSQISWQDFSSMHVQHFQLIERRLPTPIWSLDDRWLRKLLVLFLEARVHVQNPKDDLITRRAAAEKNIKTLIPKWNATIDRLQLEYVAAQHNGTPKERLQKLEIEIENLDTLVRVTQKGTLALVAALVVLYYRMGKTSVEVGEELGMKPPHVRATLWRLHQIWNKTFNLDFNLEPAAPAVPACRSYSPQEIDGMLAAGKITIPKDKPKLQPPPETEFDIQKRSAPVRAIRRAARGCPRKIDVQRAAQLKAEGLSWKEVAAKLGMKNEQSVRNSVTLAGLLVPSKRGPKLKAKAPTPAAPVFNPESADPIKFPRPARIPGEGRKERRLRLIAIGVCGNCEIRECGDHAECSRCRAYYNEWGKNHPRKKKAEACAPARRESLVYA